MLATWGANQGFSPSSLFSAGEPGAWYDPSDLTTLFQDAAGTTPVTAVEQPVGRMLDKSGRGNHATQSTSANRPTLSARYNLLTKTEQFNDTGVWSRDGGVSVSADQATAPDGTMTADLISGISSSGIIQATTQPSNVQIITRLSVRGGTGTQIRVRVFSAGTANFCQVNFNTSTEAISASNNGTASGAAATFTKQLVGSDTWYNITLTGTPQAAAGNNISFYIWGVTGTFYLWGADLRVANDGVGIPAYQRVNTATDYDTVGFPTYLNFNGSSSAMVTNTITPGTDKAQVFAGVRKVGTTAGLVAELDTQYATGNGKIALFSPTEDGPNFYGFYSKGSISSPALSNGYIPPITNAITGIGDISGDSAILRVNGTQAASSTSDQGTGNYLAYPLYIGARGGTSLWFNGRIYSMIVRFGSTLSTSQIANTEAYVNSKTKAY